MESDVSTNGEDRPDLDPPPGGLHTPQHQEWLLDEGVEESFPASDTPSSIQPGRIAASEQSVKF